MTMLQKPHSNLTPGKYLLINTNTHYEYDCVEIIHTSDKKVVILLSDDTWRYLTSLLLADNFLFIGPFEDTMGLPFDE